MILAQKHAFLLQEYTETPLSRTAPLPLPSCFGLPRLYLPSHM